MTDARSGPGTLCEALQATGDLPVAWLSALNSVRREDFIPDQVWVEDGGRYQPVNRRSEPDRWLDAVYGDHVVVTQMDDGRTVWPAVGTRPTCSASMPSAVLGMLDALDVQPGQRVLEIGTGTGYNAALLATRVGDDVVTSIEIDATLASQARTALAAAGYAPTVVCADGITGWPDSAPYDRIIATAAVQLGRVPYEWVEQARPGAIILVPVRTDLSSGPLVRFVVGPDGTAAGRPVRMRVGFMELRAHRNGLADWAELRWDDPSAELAETDIEPWSALLTEASRWAIGVAVPSCRYAVEKRTTDRAHGIAWLVDPLSGSWASVVPGSEKGRWDVRQHGPRRLWNEAESGYRWWLNQGSPTVDRWHFTVARDRQMVTTENQIPPPAR